MTRLIKSDFIRFFKDKLFIVICILAVFFAATTPLLYVVLLGVTKNIDPTTTEMLSSYVTAKGQFFGAFSFGNNLGLIAPLLIGIVLAHSLLTLGVSLPFFDYQTTPFVMQDFLYLLESLLFEFLIYIFIGAFVSYHWFRHEIFRNRCLLLCNTVNFIYGSFTRTRNLAFRKERH